MNDALTYRSFSGLPSDVQLIKNCFENNGLAKNQDQLTWLYVNGPSGYMECCFALGQSEDQEALAAMYALFPISFKIGSQTTLGLQSLDTITDINYRGMGLFSKLSKTSYSDCADKKYSLIYGFPNGNSAHGFFNKLGWHEISEVPFLIQPIRTNYFFKRIPFLSKLLSLIPDMAIMGRKKLRTENLKPIDLFNEEADLLWEKFSRSISIAVQRDSAYLNWRYIHKPHEDYQIQGFYQDGQLAGFIVFTVKSKHGGKIGYIMEMIYDPDIEEAPSTLLKCAANFMCEHKADLCLAWVLPHSDSYSYYRKNRFLNLPKMLRPIELHFGYKKLSDAESEDADPIDISAVKNWYLSYSDSDTV